MTSQEVVCVEAYLIRAHQAKLGHSLILSDFQRDAADDSIVSLARETNDSISGRKLSSGIKVHAYCCWYDAW